jgi:hypothetical protein
MTSTPMLTTDEWMQSHARIDPGARDLYFFLLNAARGRREFRMKVSEILPRVSRMRSERLINLGQRLAAANLIAMHTADDDDDTVVWRILEVPPDFRLRRLGHNEIWQISKPHGSRKVAQPAAVSPDPAASERVEAP